MNLRIYLLLAVFLGPSTRVVHADPAIFELIKAAPMRVADDPPKNDGTMPLTKLRPAKLHPGMCSLKYRVTTNSPECQAYVDEGFQFLYSYVYMEAARAFETATKHDPDCAIAWWGLSRAIERWGKGQHAPALTKAKELLPKTSHRESLLIKARLAEKGMLDGVTPELRKKEAAKYLDELLTLYEDDEEAWYCRGQIAEGPNAGVPFYKALLRVNPQHAGAHHELVHHYENIRRPVLGWKHALGYMESSPGLAHAFHMQAHLAMRIGKWEKTSDWSSRAIAMERAYHKEYDVKPTEDWQYSHHLETLTISLTHDGRFKEAREVRKVSEGAKFKHPLLWFRLHLAERDWDAALQAAALSKKDKVTQSYLRALVFLHRGDIERAASEVHVLQEAYQNKRTDADLELRLFETQGLLLCGRGQADAGLKLLQKTVKATMNSYKHHAWGHGAYYMENWGIAALKANKLEVAEEGFLEALAHDSGSARGALGMQVVCERQNRTEEALNFAELAQRAWRRADPGRLEDELRRLRDASTQASRPIAGLIAQ